MHGYDFLRGVPGVVANEKRPGSIHRFAVAEQNVTWRPFGFVGPFGILGGAPLEGRDFRRASQGCVPRGVAACCAVPTMKIKSAVFERSATDLASCPRWALPEFAFIGRYSASRSAQSGRGGIPRRLRE